MTGQLGKMIGVLLFVVGFVGDVAFAEPGASTFQIDRISLVFPDGGPSRVVSQDAQLTVTAELNYRGSGLLKGVWEVAGPPTTAGKPIFKHLKLISQYLVASKRQLLESPPLPTDTPGMYLVRFRIVLPQTNLETPLARYAVGSQAHAHR